MSSKDAKDEGSDSESDDDNLIGSRVKSSKHKKLKKFNYVIEKGEHIHLTKEQINDQKRLKEIAKAKMVKIQEDVTKEEWINLLGLNVVTKKGPITLKVYKEDGTDEVIPNFKASDVHLEKPLEEQGPLDRLNDLERKKRKHADDIYDLFRSTKKLKSSIQYEDHPAGNVLNEPVLDFIKFLGLMIMPGPSVPYYLLKSTKGT
uniref:Uncharacterized protein n=1 Tax=Tanacetum cinerariifolium TaxID=118510 RepID=A0A699HT56_TANCI|nr:hypothetical protein [Tanacetum cinerariifolium]